MGGIKTAPYVFEKTQSEWKLLDARAKKNTVRIKTAGCILIAFQYESRIQSVPVTWFLPCETDRCMRSNWPHLTKHVTRPKLVGAHWLAGMCEKPYQWFLSVIFAGSTTPYFYLRRTPLTETMRWPTTWRRTSASRKEPSSKIAWTFTSKWVCYQQDRNRKFT